MKIRFSPVCAGLLSFTLFASAHAGAVAFTGAEGYGANATGGTKMVHVTNLADAGPGSFRAAAATRGAKVVFDIAGTIALKSELAIASNVTLDGTTAPSPGITIGGAPVSLSKSSNVIILNLRFREGAGGPPRKCSLQGSDCSNIILDHCSIEHGRWDCMEFTGGSHDITGQWCMIGEGLPPQQFGMLLNGENRVTLHHNLFVDNKSRNPKMKANAQYINNVVYNWGGGGGLIGGHSKGHWSSDVINNFFMAGPSSNANWAGMCTASDSWYVSGNQGDFDKDGFSNPTTIPAAEFAKKGVTIRPAILHKPEVPVTIDPAEHCLELATSGAMGCQPNDDVDKRLCGYLKSYGKDGRLGMP